MQEQEVICEYCDGEEIVENEDGEKERCICVLELEDDGEITDHWDQDR